MDNNIKDCLDVIKLSAEVSIESAELILLRGDYHTKHQAAKIKSKAEDALRMVGAITELLSDKK